MHFERDSIRAQRNHRKHGVSFEEASEIFSELLSITGSDPDHSIGENRMITIGVSSSNRLLIVAHTERGDAIHIISARVATDRERSIYEEDQG